MKSMAEIHNLFQVMLEPKHTHEIHKIWIKVDLF